MKGINNISCYQNNDFFMLCSKLPWPICKIRDVVKKYEVTQYSIAVQYSQLHMMPSETETCSTTTKAPVSKKSKLCIGEYRIAGNFQGV